MSDVRSLPHCCNITIELLSLLESCALSCDAKVSEPEIKDLKQYPCITVSPDNCQDPSHKTFPEGHGQVELQCPIRSSRLAAAVMVQGLNQTKTMVCQVGRPASREYHALGNSCLNFEREHAYRYVPTELCHVMPCFVFDMYT